jgi:hypothetical protein
MRRRSSIESGLVDLVVLVAVAALLIATVLPTLISAVGALELKQALEARAFALARTASRSGIAPPPVLVLAGHRLSVQMAGSFAGCAAVTVTLSTTVVVGPGLLGTPVTLSATASAPNGAYDRPDPEGADCGAA